VFPWVPDADGLASILDKPDFWARVFADPGHREVIRRALKRATPGARFLKTDDRLVGEVVVSLLNSKAKRGVLLKQLKVRANGGHGNETLAATAWLFLREEERFPPSLLTKKTHFLSVPALSEWIQSQRQLSAELVALNAALFAILQPTEAHAIGEVLAAVPALVPLAEGSRSEPTAPAIAPALERSTRHYASMRSQSPGPRPTTQGSPPAGGANNAQVPPLPGERPLVPRSGEAGKPLTVAQGQSLHEELARKLDGLERSVAVVSANVAQFDLLGWSNLLKSSAQSWRPEAPLDVEVERLQRLSQDTTRLSSALDQSRTLAHRLRQPEPPQPRQPPDSLAAAIEAVEIVCARLQEELSLRELHEETAERFLETLTQSPAQRAEELVFEATAGELAHLLIALANDPLSERPRLKDLRAHAGETTSVLFALVHSRDPHIAAQTLAALSEDEDDFKLLAGIRLDDLQALVSDVPSLGPRIARLLFRLAHEGGRTESIDYLPPILELGTVNSACEAFYERFVSARHRGERLDFATELNHRNFGALERAQAERQACQAIDDLANQKPGMSGNYYKLRRQVRDHFFKPVADHIAQGAVNLALQAWRKHSAMEMVEVAIAREVDREGLIYDELDETHRQQTLRFIQMFARHLETLDPARVGATSAVATELGRLLDRVRVEAAANDEAKRLIRVVDHPVAPPEDFGLRFDTSPVGPVVPARTELEPRLVCCWPQSSRGLPSPLAAYATDLVRLATGAGPQDLRAAIGHYLSTGNFEAARRAAKGTAQENPTEREIAETFAAIRAKHSHLLERAHLLRGADELIEIALQDLLRSEADADVAAFENYVSELAGFVESAETLRDPRRLELLAVLKQAGVSPTGTEPLEALQRRFLALKTVHQDSREHIGILETGLSGLEGFNPKEVEAWNRSAAAIDIPDQWPSAELSYEIAAALEVIVSDIKKKWKHRRHEPSWGELCLIEATATRGLVEQALSANGRGLAELAAAIRDGSPEPLIRQLLGAAPKPFAAEPRLPRTPARPAGEVSLQPVAATVASALSLIAEYRTRIHEEAQKESAPRDEDLGFSALKRSFAIADWVAARRIAAALLRTQDSPDETKLEVAEAAYAYAWATSLPAGEPLLLEAARLGLVSPHLSPNSRGVIRSVADGILLRRSLVSIARGEDLAADQQRNALPDVVADLAAEKAPAAAAWLTRVLQDASIVQGDVPVSGTLARALWDDLEGSQSAASRRHLLAYLFKARRLEAIRALARTLGPLENLIDALLVLVERSVTDSSARIRVPPLLAALEENGRGKANIRAWAEFVASVSLPTGSSGQTDLAVTLRSKNLEVEPDDTFVLPVWIEPPVDDFPSALRIEFLDVQGKTRQLVLEDGLVLKEKEVALRVPRDWFSPGDMVDLAYRVAGVGVRGHIIDLRGQWQVQFSAASLSTPLTASEILTAWPGHTGDPVQGSEGFHGRVGDLQKICNYLRDPLRQRSVLLLGRRRVGKTSVLLELVNEFPPTQGGIAAAFIDVAGLQASPDGLSKALFDHIVGALDSKPQNETLRRVLKQQAGRHTTFENLARRIDSSQSLDHSLEALVQNISRESHGHISRLALLIDEFDRFVGDFISGGEKKRGVDALTWQLRSLIQGSKTIALVLAGSGLTRVLSDSYTAALFGSISQIEIQPFELEGDREAIEDTFVPKMIRAKLCRPEDLSRLVAHAHGLTKGHPYYLAVLGHAAASVAKGRFLTPRGLDRVVADIMSGKLARVIERAVPSTFYAHVFETLDALPWQTAAAAKVILAHVAQRSTTEFPQIPIAEAVDPVELRKLSSADKQKALDVLLQEGVVISEGKRPQRPVEIAIPITAAAIREDAFGIVQRAVGDMETGDA
jgi:hypothetical protein